MKFNTSINLSPYKKDSSEKLRRKSLLTSRNLITPPHLKNLEEEDSPTKVFMCGFDEFNLREIRDEKRNGNINSIKRKKSKNMRPMTASTAGMFDRL